MEIDIMKTILKNGKQATLTIDTKAQTATVTTEGVNKLVAFVRDAKKLVIKNDMLLNQADLALVKSELGKTIKKEEVGKKRK